MAYFVVYDTAPVSDSQPMIRLVLRWGECPPASVSTQARSSGEGATEVPTLGGLAAATSPLGWHVDLGTKALSWLGSPVVPSPSDLEAILTGKRNRILFALRASDWAVLPDAPLTTAQKNEWVTWRASVRAIAAHPHFIDWTYEITIPPSPTSTEI